ncbi:hypothetical protein ACVIGB_000523 [Bradyrhizobium sp. USDA 4341]
MSALATADLPLTTHSRTRLQQRAIPPLVVDLLIQFGSASRANGAERLMFDKSAIKRLRHHLGGDRGLKVVERWLNVYAVLGDNGLLVTAAHKSGHFRRQ